MTKNKNKIKINIWNKDIVLNTQFVKNIIVSSYLEQDSASSVKYHIQSCLNNITKNINNMVQLYGYTITVKDSRKIILNILNVISTFYENDVSINECSKLLKNRLVFISDKYDLQNNILELQLISLLNIRIFIYIVDELNINRNKAMFIENKDLERFLYNIISTCSIYYCVNKTSVNDKLQQRISLIIRDLFGSIDEF